MPNFPVMWYRLFHWPGPGHEMLADSVILVGLPVLDFAVSCAGCVMHPLHVCVA